MCGYSLNLTCLLLNNAVTLYLWQPLNMLDNLKAAVGNLFQKHFCYMYWNSLYILTAINQMLWHKNKSCICSCRRTAVSTASDFIWSEWNDSFGAIAPVKFKLTLLQHNKLLSWTLIFIYKKGMDCCTLICIYYFWLIVTEYFFVKTN